jgi:7-cyano-7-deazaguanine synthase
MKDTLLIYSGGMDSTAALYAFREQIAMAISFDYGSRHNGQEIAMAIHNCEMLDIPHVVIPLADVMKHMRSALLGDEPVPHGHYASDNMRSTVVPFRNGIMLSIATGIADSKGLKAVMIGSHSGDFAQYPDCTEKFNVGMEIAMAEGTHNHITLSAPFETFSKREVAHLGLANGMDPAFTYSCYEGEEVHCGRCGTCVERLEALKGVEDNTKYKDATYWREVLDLAEEIDNGK